MNKRALFLLLAWCLFLALAGAFSAWLTTDSVHGAQNVPLPSASQVAVSVTTPVSTEIIPAVSGNRVYLTAIGLTVSTTTATAQTVQIVYGTGTTCITGRTAMTGAFTGAAMSTDVGENMPTVLSFGNGGAALLATPASQAVCLVTTGSQPVTGFITKQQF